MSEIPYTPETNEPKNPAQDLSNEGNLTDPADAYLNGAEIPETLLNRLAVADDTLAASETGGVYLNEAAALERLAEANKGVAPALKPINQLNQIRSIPESEISTLRAIMQDPTVLSNLEMQALLNQATNEYRDGLLLDIPQDVADFLSSSFVD